MSKTQTLACYPQWFRNVVQNCHGDLLPPQVERLANELERDIIELLHEEEWKCRTCSQVVMTKAGPPSWNHSFEHVHDWFLDSLVPVATKEEGLDVLVEELCGWWYLNREGSPNATYDYLNKMMKRLRAALSETKP